MTGPVRWATTIVAAVAFALAAAPQDAYAQKDACAGPRALVTAKKIAEAKAAYIALAGTKSAPPCAAAELVLLDVSAAVATAAATAAAEAKSCDGAKALLDAQLYEEAETAYTKLASGNDPPPCAATGLKTAKDEIKAQRTRAERAGDDADDAVDWLADWGKLVLLIVAAIAVAGAIALRFGPLAAAGRKLTWWLSQSPLRHGLVRRAPRRLSRSLFAPVAWALATPIQIEPITGSGDDEGADMTRTITGLLPVVSARRTSALNVAVKPFASESALKEVTDALGGVPHGKLVTAVLSIARRLVPRNRLHLTGTVLASKARGKGLALEIVNDGGEVLDAVTLWERDFAPFLRSGSFADDPAEDRTVRLGTAGATWLLFAILRQRRVLDDQRWLRLLGTRSWESYARTLIAVGEASTRDETTTRAGYAHALDADPRNLTALFNLAQVDVKQGAWLQAAARLDRVDRTLATREDRTHLVDCDPLRYQVAYGFAYATYMGAEHDAANARKQKTADGKAIDGKLMKAVDGARKWLAPHVIALEETLLELDRHGGRPTRDHDDLYSQLRRFEGPLLTLWGYLSAKRYPGAIAGTAVPDRTAVIWLLGHPSQHAAVIQQFLPARVSVGPKTTYNLASYYAVLPATREVAWMKLEDSLDLGILATDAEKDEQLQPLRDAEPERFEKLMERFRDELTGLGAYTAIGKRGAAALEGASIETKNALLTRVRTGAKRQALANDLGVGLTLVNRWANVADLASILKVDEVNLLEAAGVGEHELLADMRPRQLLALLEAIEPKPDTDLPTSRKLKGWIARARVNPSKLEP